MANQCRSGWVLLPLVAALSVAPPFSEPLLTQSETLSLVDSPFSGSLRAKDRKPTKFRCSCFFGDKTLIALRPKGRLPLRQQEVLERTHQEYPTLFVYVPLVSSTVREAAFTLEDAETGKMLVQTTVPLPEKPGIARLELSTIAPGQPLKPGQQYRWTFTPLCNDSNYESVDGYIERIELEPSLSGKLSRATLRQKAEIYGAAGIWYDYLDSLAELKLKAPEDATIQRAWEENLKMLGLTELIGEPFALPVQALKHSPNLGSSSCQ